ncbi:undecaprenyl-diphosphate phosphatase [Blastopirellula marina]|uniref:Undecaprenyl-diphosphatase n=1 Tax=Blastopirellula marina TaxID=124 RepID=A0A2S8FXI1_9BACT|nr:MULTISPECIES: undecaprenyl-diphosphate phosphatase [Pirellulaceae]PQO36891.1 undecaprenyl-diphosphate phosphatase [Blastopirellula marina]RCS53606.1 undecaprenyl-diphosphate phosphatase [Bremerella cremea]
MDLPVWQIILLAIVQGIAEFLPISSSGHLVVLATLLGADAENFDLVELNIVLHAGTLGSILVVYRKQLFEALTKDWRILFLLAVATMPAVIAAIGLKITHADDLLESPLVAGICLLITGAILLLSQRLPQREQTYEATLLSQAWWIGCAQAFAILPGISRSGSTICSGQALGLSREGAATFSFLMAVPAILGAIVLELAKSLSASSDADNGLPAWLLLLGALVSFAVGWGSLIALLQIVQRGRLHWFAWWCFAVGLFVLVWQTTIG